MSYEVDLVNIMYCAGKVEKNSAVFLRQRLLESGKVYEKGLCNACPSQ